MANSVPHPSATQIFVWAPPQLLWPEPLASWIEFDHLLLHTVQNAYEAAAILPPHAILLLHLQNLTHQNLKQLHLIAQHLQTRIFSLPLSAKHPHAKDPAKYNIRSWEEACQAIQQSLQNPPLIPKTSYNKISANHETESGNSVTEQIADRYDELSNHPLLSEQEMRALLGAAE